MATLATISHFNLSAIDAINSTTREFRVSYLPSSLYVYTGTLANYTVIDNQVYNGSASSINGTTLIRRFPSTTIGTISIASFIYMMISLITIAIMVPPSLSFIRAITAQDTFRYSPAATMTDREFRRLLLPHYPDAPPPSYAETVPRKQGADVTPADLQECRKLIRAKYKLDVSIYNHRDVLAVNRYIVDDMRRRSAGASVDIRRTIMGWMDAKAQWSGEEWKMVVEIWKNIQGLVENPDGDLKNENMGETIEITEIGGRWTK
jgi:hypothetical protein